MLIKDEIKKMLLLQLNKNKDSVSLFTINWNDKTDKFYGSIYFSNDTNCYDYSVDFENNKFYLLFIKEIHYTKFDRIVYSINGDK